MAHDPPHDDPASIWERVTNRMRRDLPPSTFQLWIQPLRPLLIDGATLYVTCPQSARGWVERRYEPALAGALRAESDRLQHVLVVDEGTGRPEAGAIADSGEMADELALDPRHTFERFVIGSQNRLAQGAALAVAELPGEAYNPLFLHGPPGMGKTHLLGAIADYLRRRRPDLTVHCTTAERFTTEFITALRKEGPERFKRRYRKLDALLIDDVQALEGKEHTQEEFVHTFNALHAAGKQIVLSSDRPPQALARLAERLRDRFQWGLCIELAAPDLRTRTALVWRMTAEGALPVSEADVLREIAELSAGNVRLLEGTVTRIGAMSSMLREPITQGLVHRALAPSARADEAERQRGAREPTVRAIQEAVCSVLSVPPRDLSSAKRTAPVSRARQLSVYLTRELTSLSLADIARAFDRDHSTILHALRSIERRLETDPETAQALHRLRGLLCRSAPSSGTPPSLRPPQASFSTDRIHHPNPMNKP